MCALINMPTGQTKRGLTLLDGKNGLLSRICEFTEVIWGDLGDTFYMWTAQEVYDEGQKKTETHRDLDLVRDEGDNACTKTVFRCSSHTRSDATVF